MFASSKVSKSMIDAVNSVLAEKPVVQETKEVQTLSETTQVAEVAPPGFEGTVKAMKKEKSIDNPFALAWSMKNKGYKSHKKADGTPKNEEVDSVDEALKGSQHKIDKNKNNKIDAHDFKLLRKEDTVEEGWDDMLKSVADKKKPQPNGGSGIKKGKSYGNQKPEPEKEVKEELDSGTKTVDTLAGPVKGGKENGHKSFKIKLKTEEKDCSCDGKQTPSTRVQELAATAMKRVNKDLKGKK